VSAPRRKRSPTRRPLQIRADMGQLRTLRALAPVLGITQSEFIDTAIAREIARQLCEGGSALEAKLAEQLAQDRIDDARGASHAARMEAATARRRRPRA
jgi:hypothetical protein